MKWKLILCNPIDWTQDDSGYYTIINVVPAVGNIRVDLMTTQDEPAISFGGKPHDVRITMARYIEENGLNLSIEHTMYLGYEIARAELLKEKYVQE